MWVAEVLKQHPIDGYAVVESPYFYYVTQGSLSRLNKKKELVERTLIAAIAYEQQEKFGCIDPKEFLLNRRYFRNCFWGEAKVVGFDGCNAMLKNHTSPFSFVEMFHLIAVSKLSTKMKITEFLMLFTSIEAIVYRLLL